MDDLAGRLERIYSAIGATMEEDPEKFAMKVYRGDRSLLMVSNFRGDTTDAELENAACLVIHNIACLRNHIKRWADNRGRDTNKVIEAIRQSRALAIVTDLWNTDKHAAAYQVALVWGETASTESR